MAHDPSAMGGDAGPEWAILERLCRDDREESPAADVAELVSESAYDAGLLIEQAMRHNMVFHLAAVAEDPLVKPLLHKRIRSHLRDALYANRWRVGRLVAEAARVAAAVDAAGLKVACTKGVVLQQSLYDGRGTRSMSDIDLMILPEERNAVARVLTRELGYRTGRFDAGSHTIEAESRAEQLLYHLSPDHLPQMLRIPDDPLVPVYAVDCAYSLSWAASPWQVDMDAALAERVIVAGPEDLPAMTPPFAWIFTVLHLFREAWIQRTIDASFTTLAQFGDVLRFWQRCADELAVVVPPVLEKHGIGPPVGWVCGHLDELFGTDVSVRLGLTEFVTRQWLLSAMGSDGRLLSWPGSMRDRLRSRRPLALVTHPRADDLLDVAGGRHAGTYGHHRG